MKKAILTIVLFVSVSFSAKAAEYTISSINEFEALSLSPGDVVIWLDGTYTDDNRLVFEANGTAENPITLRAETPGGVIFTNGLQMNISGNYLIVDGFYWNGGYGTSNFIQFRDGSTYAQYSTIQNCAINNLGIAPGDAAEDALDGAITKHRWIVLYGNYNNVLNCTFMNKASAGALILAELDYNNQENPCAVVGHTISNNYIFNYEKIDASLSNSGDSETIRIGSSSDQNVNAGCVISNNYFVSADGENEIITNKSANNTYINNTFRRCRGSLTLRHGAGATVQGNYFLGENIDGTGGIRIVDGNHIITNNYIQDCITEVSQAKWNNGITFMGGGDDPATDCTDASVTNGYQESNTITVSNNTFVNTNAPLFFNGDKGTNANTGDVTNNIIFFEAGANNLTDVISEDDTGDFSAISASLNFSGNVYDGTTLGANKSGFNSASLIATPSGEIFDISGAGSAGANLASYEPTTNNDVGALVGACFLDASGNFLVGCESTTGANTLLITAPSVFSAQGGTQSVTVTASIDWTVTENSDWISIATTAGSGNGTVVITVSENTTITPRSATILFSGENNTRSVAVSQEGIPDENDCEQAVNLALGGTIIDFSEEQNTTNAAVNVIDGNSDNRWSAFGFPNYVVVDLGAPYSIAQINFLSYNQRPYQFKVEGSISTASDGFTTITDDTTNTVGEDIINRTFDAQTVRYVKLTVTGIADNSSEWTSVADFEIIRSCEIQASQNFTVKTTGESCSTRNDGNISITALENMEYTATINNGGQILAMQNFSETTTFDNLEAGQYDVCITNEEDPDYDACFSLNISEPEALSASSKVNTTSKTVTLSMEGSITYYIELNGEQFRTNENSITLALNKVENILNITGDKGCQGSYDKVIVLSDSMLMYPNPVVEEKVSVYLGSQNEFNTVKAALFSLPGTKIMETELDVTAGFVEIELNSLPKGIYLLNISNKANIFTHKIIK